MSNSSTSIVHKIAIQLTSYTGVYGTGVNAALTNNCDGDVASSGATCSITATENSEPEVDGIAVDSYIGNAWTEEYLLPTSSESVSTDFDSLYFIATANAPAAGVTGTAIGSSSAVWRCDNGLYTVSLPVGCVNQNYIPTVTFDAAANSNLDLIVESIQQAWAVGKPGSKASGVPLHREGSSSAADANRAAACAGFTPGPGDLTSCDEYPFARSKEGGSGAHTWPVTITAQRAQGQVLGTASRVNRLLDCDAFWVAVRPSGSRGWSATSFTDPIGATWTVAAGPNMDLTVNGGEFDATVTRTDPTSCCAYYEWPDLQLRCYLADGTLYPYWTTYYAIPNMAVSGTVSGEFDVSIDVSYQCSGGHLYGARIVSGYDTGLSGGDEADYWPIGSPNRT